MSCAGCGRDTNIGWQWLDAGSFHTAPYYADISTKWIVNHTNRRRGQKCLSGAHIKVCFVHCNMHACVHACVWTAPGRPVDWANYVSLWFKSTPIQQVSLEVWGGVGVFVCLCLTAHMVAGLSNLLWQTQPDLSCQNLVWFVFPALPIRT